MAEIFISAQSSTQTLLIKISEQVKFNFINIYIYNVKKNLTHETEQKMKSQHSSLPLLIPLILMIMKELRSKYLGCSDYLNITKGFTVKKNQE